MKVSVYVLHTIIGSSNNINVIKTYLITMIAIRKNFNIINIYLVTISDNSKNTHLTTMINETCSIAFQSSIHNFIVINTKHVTSNTL